MGGAGDEVLCVVLSVVGGVVNGSFMTPHRVLQRRQAASHEKIWLLYSCSGLLLMPWACALLFVGPDVLQSAYQNAAPRDLALTVAMGAVWGFGSVAMGFAVQLVGQSVSFALILGTMASCGSLAALAVQHTDEMLEKEGILCMVGLAVALVALILCVWAGLLKDKSKDAEEAAATWLGRTIIRDYTHSPYKENYLARSGGAPAPTNSGPLLGAAAMYGSLGGGGSISAILHEGDGESSFHDSEKVLAGALSGENDPLLGANRRGKGVAEWQTERNFARGVLVCFLGGILATGMNMIVVLGNNIINFVKDEGTDKEYAALVTWTMGVGIGGFSINALYSVMCMVKRRKSLDPLERAPVLCCCCSARPSTGRTSGAWALRTNTEVETGIQQKSVFWREDREINAETFTVRCCDARVALFWCLGILMGVLWFGGTFMYGAASQLSNFGTVAGWPIFILTVIITANVWGALLGEWKGSHWKERGIMIGALVIMGGAIVTIGFSAQ